MICFYARPGGKSRGGPFEKIFILTFSLIALALPCVLNGCDSPNGPGLFEADKQFFHTGF